MPNPSPEPARRRRGSRRRRSAPAEALRIAALNEVERELLACFCAPGARLLALGTGAAPEAAAAARLGYCVTAVDLPPTEALAPPPAEPDVAVEWLRADSLALPVDSGRFDAAIVLGRLLERVPTRSMRAGLLREAARAVRAGGHVIVSARSEGASPGWRRWLWEAADRRAARGGGWQRIEPAAALDAGTAKPVYPAAALLRDAAAAGLRPVAELPWPTPAPGALGTVARRGAAFRYAALEVMPSAQNSA